MQDYLDILAEVLIDENTLQKRVKELADEINRDYAGEQILLICVLRGALPFMVDLMRHLSVLNAIDCMAVSSYGEGARASSGNVRMTLDLQTNILGKHVILVEDIVDSGHTIAHVIELLRTRKPKTLKVCALLDKSSRREVDVPIDYKGFTIANKFVFGYGLDLDEFYRNLPFIGVVDLDRYVSNG
ncbi:MAG: hypoxanthine phosphoribosyltransferase [Chloroflexi bacterium]|nr:hypoxanthine phosphoribosyltransferase [Chloroflexota bacterium]